MRNALGIAVVMAVFFSMACSSLTKHLANGRTVYGKTDQAALEEKDYIEGYVLDSKTKKGIEGAIVEVKNANMGVGYYRLTTDSDGYFRIDDFIKHIRYTIEVVADGYVTSVSTEKIRGGRYTVYLDREGILTGIVRDSSGKPLKGIEIRLKGDFRHTARTDAVTHTTAESGRYRFDKLKEAAYTVTFRGTGYITETARIKKIKSGETFTLPMMMLKPSTIAGTVLIQGIKTPAINVDITLKGRTTHSTSTFQDGSYFITDIKPGYYKIHISHRGFYKFVTGTIRIKEGMKRENYNFTVRPKPPKVSVYAYRYTFSPGTKVAFNIRTFRLEKVRMRVYSVPIGLLLSGRTDPNKIRPAADGLKVVDQWDEAVRNFKPYEWRYSSIGARKPLSTGGYCIEILGAGKTYDRKFFTVTSVGVVVKRSRDSIFAYVTDLVNNRPVAGAQIVVFDNTPKKKEYRQSHTPHKPPERIEDLPVKIISKGKTDSNGIYHLRKRSTLHLSLLAIHPDRSYAFCSTGHPYIFKSELNKYFIYTDRPVYRAGDTVFYKIVGKSRGKRFTPIRNRRLNYQISNIDFDEDVDDGELVLDAWGTGHGKLKLAADTHLGTYELRVGEDPDNLYGVGRFYVEQYRKPEFTIEITPSKDYYVNGDTAEFKVEAKYFFGAPLKGALLRYRFYETKLRDTDTVYWWEEDYGSTSYFYRIKLEGEKYADDSGITVLRIHCGDYPYDREITLEVTAIDKSNVSITSRKGVTVGRGAFYIKINPRKNFFADDEKKQVAIKTITYSGKPVQTRVRVQLFRYIWKPWERVYVHSEKPLFERQVNTNEKGVYTLELPKKFDVYGEFDIVADARDSRDNAITASRVLWIYSRSGARVASRFKNLELTVNKSKLTQAGDITCLLKSRFSDASVCLTLEGRDIYESRVVRMAGNIMPVTMRIKSDYAPNLFITATMQRKRALFTTSTEITLPNPDTSLTIGIRTDKKQYLPGEKARVTMKVTDEKGKPVQADLSLGSVDEAIYQIRPDHTPRMVDFFYSKISNWVMTNYSYPITLLAGMSKEKKVKVREKFRDTAYWNPTIRTGRDGLATIAFTLPDNLTTWRLTVRGHDNRGRVGEKREKFLVTQDLIARIGKPRFLIEGDTLGLIGIVNSNTKRGLKRVETDFRVDEKPVKPDKEIAISLPPYGSARSYYTVKVPEKKRVKVFFKAVADRDAKDALRVGIPVESRGVAFKLYSVGDMAQNKRVVLEPIGDTEDFDFKPQELVISLNPSPISRMVKATKFLAEYPYGCIEQVINKFMPNLVLKELLKKQGLEGLIQDKKLDDKVRAGIDRIQNYQNDDGTWGWFYGGRGNEFITGYVLIALYRAHRLGFVIDEQRVRRGLEAISKMFSATQKMEGDAKAYLLYVSALWMQWNREAFADLVKEKEYNPYKLAFMVRAISQVKRIPNVKKEIREEVVPLLPKYLSMLKEMQKRDSRGIYWESSAGQRFRWQGGRTEISAHVLSSLIDSGDRSPLLSQLVSSITKRGRGDAWNSTKETATVFFALCNYLDTIGGDMSGTGTVHFDMGGERVSSISYDVRDTKKIEELTRKIEIKKEKIQKQYVVLASGKAGADVSFDLTLKGNLSFKEKGLLSFLTSPERSLRSLENGIGLVRRFYTVTRVRDVNNNEYIVPQDLSGKNRIRIGDEILVKVKFRAQDNFEYLILEDYLPSGFEVINKNPYGEYQPYVHLERWDNRMVYFFTKLKKDEIYEVAYILRAELPGDFMVKPARMECMYEPSIQGWSAPARFTVEKK